MTSIMNNGTQVTLATPSAIPTAAPVQAVGQSTEITLPVLKIGMAGEAVRFLQQRLINFGYRIGFNGQFGPQTHEAVLDFQLYFGLVVDGIVGYNTWLALCEDENPYLGRFFHYPLKTTKYPYSVHLPELQKGDYGSAVECLQLRLYANGFFTFVDGDFGPVTQRAVEAFQRREGLVADGIVGRLTWRKLG